MADFVGFLPTIREDAAIASQILAHVDAMKRDGSFLEGAALCWDPPSLERLAMFAISAKDLLRRAGVLLAAQPKSRRRDGYEGERLAILAEIKRLGIPTVARHTPDEQQSRSTESR